MMFASRITRHHRWSSCMRHFTSTTTTTTERAASRHSIRFHQQQPRWLSSTSGTESITYSGGQPSVGQGGFYGSGGARALTPDTSSTTDDDDASQQKQNQERNKMLAMAHDVQTVRLVMQELDLLESLLRNEEESKSTTGSSGSPSSSSDAVSPKSMEIKNSMKKLMTSTDFLESLNNLEVQGEPAWGLSCEEREMIVLAREKVNAC